MPQMSTNIVSVNGGLLNDDVYTIIVEHLPFDDLLSFRLASRRFQAISNPSMRRRRQIFQSRADWTAWIKHLGSNEHNPLSSHQCTCNQTINHLVLQFHQEHLSANLRKGEKRALEMAQGRSLLPELVKLTFGDPSMTYAAFCKETLRQTTFDWDMGDDYMVNSPLERQTGVIHWVKQISSSISFEVSHACGWWPLRSTCKFNSQKDELQKDETIHLLDMSCGSRYATDGRRSLLTDIYAQSLLKYGCSLSPPDGDWPLRLLATNCVTDLDDGSRVYILNADSSLSNNIRETVKDLTIFEHDDRDVVVMPSPSKLEMVTNVMKSLLGNPLTPV